MCKIRILIIRFAASLLPLVRDAFGIQTTFYHHVKALTRLALLIWFNVNCLLLCAALTGCGSHKEHDHEVDKEAQTHDENAHGEEIIFTPEQAKAGGVETEKVIVGDFREGIKVSGQVLGALDDEMSVIARQSGVVNLLRSLTEGMSVGNGEALFLISAEGIGDGNPLKLNRLEYKAAKKEYERGKELFEDKLITAAELTELKLRMDNAKAEKPTGWTACAPISGMIKSLKVRSGEYVEQGTVLAVLTKNKKLQLRAEVSEKYYNHLHHISGANFRLTGQSDTWSIAELGGRLVSYSHSTAEDVCFVPVIFEFENKGDIVAGSFADVYLLGILRENVISVPISALTEEQGLFYVYVKVDEEGYLKREVKIGETDGKRREITAGLSQGEEVVTKGAVLIKLASMSGNIPEGHSHNH